MMLVVLALVGCGDSGADRFGETEPGMSGTGIVPPPPGCDPAARTGLYWVDYTTISGDCGEVADGLEQLSAEPNAECMRLAADEWRDDNCTLVRSVLCDAPPKSRASLPQRTGTPIR